MLSLVDLQLERIKKWKKYFENPTKYAKKIKEVILRRDPSTKVLIFGSVAKGKARPSSDIDLLVITELALDVEKRIKLRVEIARK